MKVFITRPIPDNGIQMLKAKGYDVVDSPKDADAVLCQLTDVIDAHFFDQAPNLKIVANFAVGFNNIDINEAKKRSILVTNAPEGQADSVAEHSMGLLLALAHKISEGDRYIRSQRWRSEWKWDFMLGGELKGKTLGILGPGRIGSRLGEIAQAFGMRVKMCGPDDNLDEFLAGCDAVSVHVPLLESTHHLLNANRLGKMKPTAYLINTSRGHVIDETALIDALQQKKIAGAGLDVFEEEPLQDSDLLKLENVVLTPHIASATQEARMKMAEVAATNIIEALEGRTPPNLVK